MNTTYFLNQLLVATIIAWLLFIDSRLNKRNRFYQSMVAAPAFIMAGFLVAVFLLETLYPV